MYLVQSLSIDITSVNLLAQLHLVTKQTLLSRAIAIEAHLHELFAIILQREKLNESIGPANAYMKWKTTFSHIGMRKL